MSNFHVKELRWHIQKVFPSVYDDSLSYYELISKVLAKLNELISELNEYFSEDLTKIVGDILQEWYDNGKLSDIITETILSELSRLVKESVIYNIPSDYPSLQEALDDLSTRTHKQGTNIFLNIESGFSPTTGISVKDGDYAHFIITSSDPVVVVSPGFAGDFIYSSNAKAPQLGCLVNMNRRGRAGVWLENNSSGVVLGTCGVINCYERGLYVNKGSVVWAEGSDWRGGRVQTLWVSRGSTANVDNAYFGNSAYESIEEGGEPVSVHISRNSQVYGLNMNVDNSQGAAIKVQRGSMLSAPNLSINGNKDGGLQVTGGSVVYAEQCQIFNSGGVGIINQGSVVNANRSQVMGSVDNDTNGVQCEMAGIMNIDQTVIRDFGKIGLYGVRAGTINASSSQIIHAKGNSVFAEQGSVINLRNAIIEGIGTYDLAVQRGGIISAFDCKTRDLGATPNIQYTNVSRFNVTNSNLGVIWAGDYEPTILEDELLTSRASDYLTFASRNDMLGMRFAPYGNFWIKPDNNGDIILEGKAVVRKDGQSYTVQSSQRGTSTGRPSSPVFGEMFYDTTLIKPIWYTEGGWRDANGSIV